MDVASFYNPSGLQLADRLGLFHIHFVILKELNIILKIIFRVIPFYFGRKAHIILFDCQCSYCVPSIFQPVFQPCKLCLG